jgi:anaerobic selenocysteine-containing dehydrogenase
VAALAEHVLENPSRLEALLIVGADPVSTSPAGDRLREALAKIPLVVALTPFETATAMAADYVLPTHVPLEAWQDVGTPATVGFSVLGLAHPVIEPLHDTRHPGDVLLELARRSKTSFGDDPPWSNYRDYLEFRIAGLAATGQGSVVAGSFEESWIHFLEERGWRFQQDNDPKSLWKDLVQAGAWWDPVHSAGDWARLFPTPSGRYEFFSQLLESSLIELGRSDERTGDEASAFQRGIAALGLAAEGDEACLPHYEPPHTAGEGVATLVPFRPVTSRGPFANRSPMVLEMFGYPLLTGWRIWAELAPATAAATRLYDGDRVEIRSDRGSIEAVVRVRAGTTPGVVHVPLGLALHKAGGWDDAVAPNPVEIIEGSPDKLSGALSLASTRVQLRLIERRPHGGPPPGSEVLG